MQKDYNLRITNDRLEEVDEIESYWTNKWIEQDYVVPDLSTVPLSEEYNIIGSFLDELPKKLRILDGGCGLGHWTLYLNQQGHQTTGLDISVATINHLKKAHPETDFITGDIRNIDISDNSFDAYISWGTFEHFENGMGSVIDEAFRIMKPGGLVFATMPYDNVRHRIRRSKRLKFPQVPSEDTHIFYQWRFTRGELCAEFTQRGFQVELIKPLSLEQGVSRMLDLDFGIKRGSKFHAYVSKVLAMIMPACLVGHMLMIVARKPT